MADPHEACTGMSGLHVPPLGELHFHFFQSPKITLTNSLKVSVSQNMRQIDPQSGPPGTPKGDPNPSNNQKYMLREKLRSLEFAPVSACSSGRPLEFAPTSEIYCSIKVTLARVCAHVSRLKWALARVCAHFRNIYIYIYIYISRTALTAVPHHPGGTVGHASWFGLERSQPTS